MAIINTKVMLNLIDKELKSKGRASRLLPNDLAKGLYDTFLCSKYIVQPNGSISNGNTSVTFTQGTSGVRVLFTKL